MLYRDSLYFILKFKFMSQSSLLMESWKLVFYSLLYNVSIASTTTMLICKIFYQNLIEKSI